MDKHFAALDHQDWKTVVVKTKQSNTDKKTTTKKLSDSQQKDIKLLKQVEEGNLKHKKVSPEIRKLIQQKRGELKWTQKDLAQRCNFQVTIINDIETGKANYNPQHITKIKRILKL
jgi:ribosome-binding protein aMBF1 (putative translation factor)